MTPDFAFPPRKVTAADLHLLLAEELCASPLFQAYVAARAGLSAALEQVQVCPVPGGRQGVILKGALAHGEQVALPIHVWLGEEPHGMDLAHAGGVPGMDLSGSQTWLPVLVCNRVHVQADTAFATRFAAVITCGQLERFFRNAAMGYSGEAWRLWFRADVMRQAVEQSLPGKIGPDEAATGLFNAGYARLLDDVAPDLRPHVLMWDAVCLGGIDAFLFDPAAVFDAMPPRLRPSRFHQCYRSVYDERAGEIVVLMPGWGDVSPEIVKDMTQRAERLRARFMPTGHHAQEAGLAMICPAPLIDSKADLASQREAIMAGIEIARAMCKWLKENIASMEFWMMRKDWKTRGQP